MTDSSRTRKKGCHAEVSYESTRRLDADLGER